MSTPLLEHPEIGPRQPGSVASGGIAARTGTITFTQGSLSSEDPRKAIATARAKGDSVAQRTAQFCETTGMPLPEQK